MTGNKGEWSEFYTFLKIITERQLNGADENLLQLQEVFYPVLKIIRNETSGQREYEFANNGKVRVIEAGSEIAIVDSSDLKGKITTIFDTIKNNTQRTFSVPMAEELMEHFHVQRLNAGSARKEDIILKIHDRSTGMDPDVGFSIKSMLGSSATLLNASSATNFTFEIKNLPETAMVEINTMIGSSKVRDRLKAIIERGGEIKYLKTDSSVFERNLRKVDTVLPEIMAETLLAYYGGKGSSLGQLLERLHDNGTKILEFDLDKSDYEFKIKALLHNVALGMVPNTPWDGLLRAHGGYIIVREDGEIVCYHVYNADEFRTYLFKNTKFETPSTDRHKFGVLYLENGKMFFKLNLQIRFR